MPKNTNKKFTPEDQLSFRNDKCFENLRRLSIISKVLTSYIIWLGCIYSYAILFGYMDFSQTQTLFYLYIVFFLFNLLVIAVCQRLFRSKMQHPIIFYEAFLMFCISVILVFGVIISVEDQHRFLHLMVYLICTICCLSYFLLSTRQLAIPFTASLILLIVGINITQSDKALLMSHYINIALFLPVAFLISRIIYHDYKTKFWSIKLLEKEGLRNKALLRELEQASHILRKLASIDELTGIANRRGLNHYLELSLEGCANHKLPVSAAIVDIDFFKEYNDTYGHLQGDQVLKELSEQLSIIAAEVSGLAARWGGEEFVVAVCGMTADELNEMCVKIMESTAALSIEHITSRICSKLTVSIGACSMFIKTQGEFTKCIECSDKALYYAKSSGRNKFKCFDFTNIPN